MKTSNVTLHALSDVGALRHGSQASRIHDSLVTLRQCFDSPERHGSQAAGYCFFHQSDNVAKQGGGRGVDTPGLVWKKPPLKLTQFLE